MNTAKRNRTGMIRLLPALAAGLALLTSGGVAGYFTQRWAPAPDLDAMARRTLLPAVVGDWEGHDEPEIRGEREAARVLALSRKTYTHRATGRSVTAVFLSGKAGPVSVHTPDVCYPNSGFDEVGRPATVTVAGREPSKVWVRRFQKRNVLPQPLTVYYAWSDGGRWQAPDNPRLAYSRKPALYKIYVVSESAPDGKPGADEPATELLRALLPLLPSPS